MPFAVLGGWTWRFEAVAVWWVALPGVCSFGKTFWWGVRTPARVCAPGGWDAARCWIPQCVLHFRLSIVWSLWESYNSFFYKEEGVFKCKPLKVSSSVLIVVPQLNAILYVHVEWFPLIELCCTVTAQLNSLIYVLSRYICLRTGLPFRETQTGYSDGLNKTSWFKK